MSTPTPAVATEKKPRAARKSTKAPRETLLPNADKLSPKDREILERASVIRATLPKATKAWNKFMSDPAMSAQAQPGVQHASAMKVVWNSLGKHGQARYINEYVLEREQRNAALRALSAEDTKILEQANRIVRHHRTKKRVEKPYTGYICFNKEFNKRLREQSEPNTKQAFAVVSRMVSEQWKAMTPEEKDFYAAQARKEYELKKRQDEAEIPVA